MLPRQRRLDVKDEPPAMKITAIETIQFGEFPNLCFGSPGAAGRPPPLPEGEEQLRQGGADLVRRRHPDRLHDALLVDHDVVGYPPETEARDVLARGVDEDRALDVVDLAEMEGFSPWIDVFPHVDHDDLEPELRGPTAHFLE
jgi:hypothetical protein